MLVLGHIEYLDKHSYDAQLLSSCTVVAYSILIELPEEHINNIKSIT